MRLCSPSERLLHLQQMLESDVRGSTLPLKSLHLPEIRLITEPNRNATCVMPWSGTPFTVMTSELDKGIKRDSIRSVLAKAHNMSEFYYLVEVGELNGGTILQFVFPYSHSYDLA